MTAAACGKCQNPGCRSCFPPHPSPRPRGRPRLDDKRKPRGGFSDAEWARVKACAAVDGVTAARFLRDLVDAHVERVSDLV